VVTQEAANKVWLVVEDDPSIRLVVSTLIKLWSCTPLVFEDGHQAYSWLDQVEAGTYKQPLPELALLDIKMPGPQGYEIAKRLRSIDSTAKIPIVMMTAWRFNPVETERINQANPEKIINKPLPMPDELKILLEKVIAEAKAKQKAEPPGTEAKKPVETPGTEAKKPVETTDKEVKKSDAGSMPPSPTTPPGPTTPPKPDQ
jgi:CheY-like chemotaxis protein